MQSLSNTAGVSIIVPFVHVDEELKAMTAKCIESFIATMSSDDEFVLVDDTKTLHGNAWAWNEGIRRATKEVILLSDNDIEVVKWRAPMLELLEKCDIVFPKVYNHRSARIQRHVAGEFFMFRKSLIDEIGLFDETYGSYFEDTDFFERAIKTGHKLGLAEFALVLHKSKGTFSKIWGQKKQDEVFERNKKLYESKFGAAYPYLNLL